MPSPLLSLRRDAYNSRTGRIAERALNLGGEAETRRYAYDSAGSLARVTDGSGGLLQSCQYDHQGRRLADTGLTRFVWRAPFGVHYLTSAAVPWVQKAEMMTGWVLRRRPGEPGGCVGADGRKTGRGACVLHAPQALFGMLG